MHVPVYVTFQHYYSLNVNIKVRFHNGATAVIMVSVQCNTVELTLRSLQIYTVTPYKYHTLTLKTQEFQHQPLAY
jgi:uncharacterized ubiquitin-like protein YukD